MTLTAANHPLARLIAATRGRRGSILILVIALLVLLLIVGVAFLTSSRTERYAAVQDQVNTQADLLLGSVENLLTNQVVGKYFTAPSNVSGAQAFRYASNAVARYSSTYESPAGDLYLASRIPEQPLIAPTNIQWVSTSLMPTPGALAGQPLCEMDATDGTRVVLIWAYDTTGGTTYTHGDIVSVLGATSNQYYTPTSSAATDPSTATTGWDVVDPKAAFRFIPAVVQVPLFGQSAPSLYVYNTLASGTQPAFNLNPAGGRSYQTAPAPNKTFGAINDKLSAIPAADADGDGVPDAGFVRLPVGQLDGVTYYAAIRVVDGNSAVNASSAWRSDAEMDNSATNAIVPAPLLGMFRSNIGLQQLLKDPTAGAPAEIAALNTQIRYNGNAIATNYTPYIESPATAVNYAFLNQGDLFESLLTRRPGNPGYYLDSAGTTHTQMGWIGQSLTAALANRFCLMSASVAPSVAEVALKSEMTLPTTLRTYPYAATNTDIGNWFNDNFKFTTTSTAITAATTTTPSNVSYNASVLPIRSIVVGNNAVSNGVTGHYVNRGAYNASNTYYFGDWVTISDTTSANYGRAYVCVMDNTTAIDPSVIPAPQPRQASSGLTVPDTVAQNKNWEFAPWTNMPVKASANTATFGQLWASYWNVMWDHPYPAATGIVPQTAGMAQPPFAQPLAPGSATTDTNQASNNEIAAATPNEQARMFRNPIRDPATATAGTKTSVRYMTPGQVMVLRSAAAALNTISLRQASGTTNASTISATGLDDVISRQITIPLDPADPDTEKDTTLTAIPAHAYDVMLFGATKQPYISEVYANANTTASQSYIGIELCNPTPTDMVLTGWQIATLTRSTTGYATMTVKPLSTATDSDLSKNTPPGAPKIPKAVAGVPGTLLLSSGTSPPSGIASTNVVNIKSLAEGVGTVEYVILRPRLASGVPSKGTDPNNIYDEGTTAAPNYGEMVPVDQIDTSALTPTATGAAFSYRRANSPTNCAWHFVYPGSYTFATSGLRQKWVTASGTASSDQGFGSPKTYFGGATANTSATYQTFSVQVANTDSAGFNQSRSGGPNTFPFGGFARNGDLMQVPYSCGYRILTNSAPTPLTAASTTRVIEMNSLSMDLAFTDAQDTAVQETAAERNAVTAASSTIPTTPATAYPEFREQIGRFCPVGDPTGPTVDFLGSSAVLDSTSTKVIAANTNVKWRYHWTKKLFDFVTVQAPHDDYAPNADPYDFPGATLPIGTANRRSSVVNAATAGTSEDTVGVEGQVNINTAPFPVLAAVPFFPAGTDKYTYVSTVTTNPVTGTNDVPDKTDDNANLAQAIIDYRNAHGAFKSLYDLYKVPFFKFVNDQMIQGVAANEPGNTSTATNPNYGDLSPNTATTDGVRFDFEERFLLLNRVSNLLTTRSDTFTCYVLLQGYRGVDSGGPPTLVVQRRAAFLLDRNSVTPTNRSPTITVAPTN